MNGPRAAAVTAAGRLSPGLGGNVAFPAANDDDAGR
jgi:hypothetical protein